MTSYNTLFLSGAIVVAAVAPASADSVAALSPARQAQTAIRSTVSEAVRKPADSVAALSAERKPADSVAALDLVRKLLSNVAHMIPNATISFDGSGPHLIISH